MGLVLTHRISPRKVGEPCLRDRAFRQRDLLVAMGLCLFCTLQKYSRLRKAAGILPVPAQVHTGSQDPVLVAIDLSGLFM